MARRSSDERYLKLLVLFKVCQVLIVQALLFESVDGYLLTTPRDTIALTGDRVELDCITNTSRTVDWFVRYHDSIKEEWIARGNRTGLNISDAYRLQSTEVGQFVLVIDPVLTTFAGRYDCSDEVGKVPFYAELTVLDPIPSCDESAVSPWKNVVCSFRYAGNLTLELEWLTPENALWSSSCNSSTDSVQCRFESSCSVHKQSRNSNAFLTFCSGDNYTCQWGKDSSSFGLLRIKGYNKTIGSWQCNSNKVETTPTGPGTPTPINSQNIVLCNETTVLALIVVVFILGITTFAAITILTIIAKRLKKGKQTARSEFNQAEMEAEQIPYPMVSYENVDLPENVQIYLTLESSQTQPPAIYTNLQ